LLLSSGGLGGGGCPEKRGKELTGGGGTFPYPLYFKKFVQYNKNFSGKIKYQSIRSGGGIRQLHQQNVHFCAPVGRVDDKQQKEAKGGKILHVPTVAGAVAIVYNIPGEKTQLKLTPDVLSDIYLKKIKTWDDARIKALNPDVKLPSQDIAVVHRSDGSGSTFIF